MSQSKSGGSIRWHRFEKALKSYVFSAADVVDSAFEDPNEYPKSSRWEWQEGSGAEREFKNHEIAVWRCENRLEKLSEYKNLLLIIAQEKDLSNYLNGWERTGHSGSRIAQNDILHRFNADFLDRLETLEDREKCYEALYPEFERAILRTEIEIEIVAHLQGFYSDIQSYRITDNIKLKKLNLSQLNDLYGDENSFRDGTYHKYRHVLKSKCIWTRFISQTYSDNHEASFPEQQVILRMHEIVDAMRTFRPGYLNIDNVSYHSCNFEINPHGGGIRSSTETIFGDPMVLNKSDLTDFVQYHNNYLEFKPIKKKKFANAFRWLAGSSVKKSLDDRFLDYMIVLESLYLEDRNELAYRLPLRAAYYLENIYMARNTIFRLLKKGYSLRSSMVHDGNALPKEIKFDVLDFKKVYKAEDFVNEIANIVYRTIQRIVISQGTAFPSEADSWDKLILSNRLDG